MATAVHATQTCCNFINGECVESHSGRALERGNSANLDEVFADVPRSTCAVDHEAGVAIDFYTGLKSVYLNYGARKD